MLPQAGVGHPQSGIAQDGRTRVEAPLDEALGDLAQQENLADARSRLGPIGIDLLDHPTVAIEGAHGPHERHGHSPILEVDRC